MIQTNSKFVYTSAIKKLRQMRKRIRVVPGGTSAGKTYGILPVLIDYAIKNPMSEISVVSHSIPHLRKGALKDFLKIMRTTNRYFDQNFNRTLLTYTFANGSYIEFFSADQEDKVRGPRRDVLYINECDKLSFETYHQLAIRSNDIIWLDFNPVCSFWVHEELGEDPDAEWLTLTYMDNEALHDSIKRELDKAREKSKYSDYWENWWRVYGLGLIGKLEGVVFDNWKEGEFKLGYINDDEDWIPFPFHGFGLDFGYSLSYDALIELSIDLDNLKIYMREKMYSQHQSTDDLRTALKQICGEEEIIADRAEGRLIDDLKSDVNIKRCIKGPDSVIAGIRLLHNFELVVDPASRNLKFELKHYMWDEKKPNQPVDEHNHLLDAVRYFAYKKLKGRFKGIW